jgi:spore coat polysaccharide biosynthesis predicted glycosyltransferase SpsG
LGNIAVIVIDMLNIPVTVLKYLRNYCDLLIVFDDLNRLENSHFKGIIVQPQETFRQETASRNQPYVIKGADFFPLRRIFRVYRVKKSFRAHVRNILVTLGGSAPASTISMLIRVLDSTLEDRIFIHAVLGYSLIGEKRYSSKRVIIHQNMKNLAAFIAKADAAIISGGFTKFECMCIGTPFCIVSRNAHQRKLAEKFSTRGFAVNLGHIGSRKSDAVDFGNKVLKFLRNDSLRHTMFKKTRKLVDGKGSVRILKLVNAHLERGKNE